MIQYLCKSCCEKLEIEFSGMAENTVGRKECIKCSDNQDRELHIINEDDTRINPNVSR